MNLENQSESMKTIVETFVQEEVSELVLEGDKLDEWKVLVKEMNLVGQDILAVPKKSPIPFLYMKSNMDRMFTVLCPVKTNIEDFNKTPIPLEILKMVSLANAEEYFDKIEIWYDDKTPDPVCVGQVKMWGEWNNYKWRTLEEASIGLGIELGNYSYQTSNYLIGKWGDVKYSFEKLMEMAMNRRLKSERTRLEENVKEAEKGLNDIIINNENYFN